MSKWIFFLFFLTVFLFGCTAQQNYAPVINAWEDPGVMKSRYRVQNDDTLYSIAWAFDLDYRDLAQANNLSPPYHLCKGQTLTMHVIPTHKEAPPMPDAAPEVTSFPVRTMNSEIENYQENYIPQNKPNRNPSKVSSPNLAAKELTLPEIELKALHTIPSPQHTFIHKSPELSEMRPIQVAASRKDTRCIKMAHWQWPAQGKVVKGFSLEQGGNKGIDIAGHLGDPIKAVAPGKVVYSGCGLRGYGNLIIIKHSDNYLSAYAHNKKLLVREGDVVQAGKAIAKMGQTSNGDVLLHFEIRRNGKPVNPLLYL